MLDIVNPLQVNNRSKSHDGMDNQRLKAKDQIYAQGKGQASQNAENGIIVEK